MTSRTWSQTHRQPARRAQGDGMMQSLMRGIGAGLMRARQRRDLAALSDHALRDIGLSRAEVELEINKPIWRA